MDAVVTGYYIGWIIGYIVGFGITMVILWWVIRGAVLSALTENRRRVADEKRFLRDYDAGVKPLPTPAKEYPNPYMRKDDR